MTMTRAQKNRFLLTEAQFAFLFCGPRSAIYSPRLPMNGRCR